MQSTYHFQRRVDKFQASSPSIPFVRLLYFLSIGTNHLPVPRSVLEPLMLQRSYLYYSHFDLALVLCIAVSGMSKRDHRWAVSWKVSKRGLVQGERSTWALLVNSAEVFLFLPANTGQVLSPLGCYWSNIPNDSWNIFKPNSVPNASLPHGRDLRAPINADGSSCKLLVWIEMLKLLFQWKLQKTLWLLLKRQVHECSRSSYRVKLDPYNMLRARMTVHGLTGRPMHSTI